MLKFQETAKHVTVARLDSACSDAVIARRYIIQRKLGNGSFGSVYLVSDRKAKQGEELKVLKEISVGDLKPNETVEANLEAQLLSKLDHPAIVKFYASFVERDSFCIITEYCEGGDLDFKIQEYKNSGKLFTQRQVIDWFIQLLLGVNYMHERSVGCILYEMCCMNHAFTGHNFLSVMLKIVEGDTPSLPDRYPSKLNAVLCSMLNKNPSLRPAAAEILKIPYIDEQLKYNFTNMTVKDKVLNWQKEAAPIFDAVQRKVHLQTLQELSEVQKMTPRERMRLRKLNAADEKAKKLKQLAEEKYQENIKRMQEFRARNFQQLDVNVLHESDERTSKPLFHSQPVITCEYVSIEYDERSGNEPSQFCVSELTDHEIPEDPEIAEEYYNDEFESCSEGSEEEEDVEVSQAILKTNQQDSDIEAMVKYLESVLNNSSLDPPLGSWEQRYLSLCTAISSKRDSRMPVRRISRDTWRNWFLEQAIALKWISFSTLRSSYRFQKHIFSCKMCVGNRMGNSKEEGKWPSSGQQGIMGGIWRKLLKVT
ncbi:serine/threonine-protein kinase Nek11 isoform X6 [Opisthocomus hoazin]|uniref:serine/threonine-protein kinase Nek11 isoform X6 n=1 Tax=Opisthocomus hoazin TaxID=30419 RepID=UPI003F52EC4E